MRSPSPPPYRSRPAPAVVKDRAVAKNEDARRLVLGAAVGLSIENVRIFVRSLREVGYAGDVVILTGPLQWRLKRYLARYGVATRAVLSARKINGPIHAYRFLKFARIVAESRAFYDEVLVSDVRDVVFQKHPFDGIASPACHFYLEGTGAPVGAEPAGLRWARAFLPPAEIEAISRHRASCGGVVIGG